MLNDKSLICSHDQGLGRPLPTSSFALVSRDILCHCHIQVGLTYILKSFASCNVTDQPTLEYTVNLAFMDYFHQFWGNRSLDYIPTTPTVDEVTLPISMEDYLSNPDYLVYGNDIQRNPQTLKELGILWALPYVWYAIKHRKLSALIEAMTMYKASPAEAMPIGMTQGTPHKLTALDIPSNTVTKLVCHDPWVSFILAVITVLGLFVYLYQNCKHLTLVKGHRFTSIYHVHLVIGHVTRYVPLKIGQFVGLPFLFEYNRNPQVNQLGTTFT